MRLQLADSELAGVAAHGDTVQLRFAAASVVREAEAGHLAGLVLVLHGARWTGEPQACFGRIREADLRHGGERLRDLPLPCDLQGAITLHLACHAGELQVQAARVDAALRGDERWKPSYAC